MADTVVLVPGILGSQLLLQLSEKIVRREPLWLSYEELGLYGFDHLRLNPDGSEASPVYAGKVRVGLPLPEYFTLLNRQLLNDGWRVYNGSFDWRQDMSATADALYRQLLFDLTGDDFYILAYSMGGIVARLVYDMFVQSGHSDRIKRVVTIGTPHYGSYAPMINYLGRGDIFLQVRNWILARNLVSLSGSPASGLISQGMCSWPGLYELLPFQVGPGAAGDPLRPLCFQSSSYGLLQPYFNQLLSDRANTFQRGIVSTFPGGGFIVQCIGTGIPTPFRLKTADFRQQLLFDHQDGDGTVPRSFAQLPIGGVATYRSSHEALIRHPLVLQDVSGWLRSGLTGSLDRPGPVVM